MGCRNEESIGIVKREDGQATWRILNVGTAPHLISLFNLLNPDCCSDGYA